MKHQMFVVYDSKANAYMQPWFLTQQAMAQRAFSDCVNDADHNFGRHPEDYTLFKIGDFEDTTAVVKWTPPKSMGNGLEYIIKKQTDSEQLDLYSPIPEVGPDRDKPLDGKSGPKKVHPRQDRAGTR